MVLRRSLVLAAIPWLLCGCASWQRLTASPEKSRREIEERRQWAAAIPLSLPRSELVGAELPAEAAAHFVPQASAPGVRPVSWNDGPADYTIQQVGEFKVRSLGDLDRAVAGMAQESRPVRVALNRTANPPGAEPSFVDLPAETLRALRQAATPNSPLVRLEQDGAAAALIRQGGIRCRLEARAERNTGLVQLKVEIESAWGRPVQAPKEVMVRCQDASLRCLTVAETLELLYGNPKEILKAPEAESARFACVAEREDFLVPSNFKRLQAAYEKQFEPGLARQLQPALISLPGKPYPGSPVLGDARALTTYALQPQVAHPGEPPLRGWIMFAGAAVRKAHSLDVLLDLTGEQPLTISFTIPRD